MGKLIKDEIKISLEELKNRNAIYIRNIQDGFDKYPNCMIEGTEEEVSKSIIKLVNANGLENSYADFYYGRLSKEEKENVKSALHESEVRFIESLKLNENDIFVKINFELLEILLKLTAKEVLFSSFYFTKYTCLVWGNYGRRYPVFFKNDDIRKIIINEILL